MRCNVCKYAQSYVGEGSAYFEEDSCTLCWLTDESEQTENKYGEIGCIFNQRTLDKRRRQLDEEYKNGYIRKRVFIKKAGNNEKNKNLG